MQGEDATKDEDMPAGASVQDLEPGDSLADIDFDDGKVPLRCGPCSRLIDSFTEDQTNIHRHAKRNAQEAIAMARRKAQDFDTQAALERKTNEALKLAKAQAHVRDDEGETSATSSTPLVDRMCLLTAKANFTLTPVCSGLR